jgi:hypothetical protein
MRTCTRLLLAAVVALPTIAAAQSPVATAFKQDASDKGKNLIAAAEIMPAEHYGFKPTPAQMSFGDIVVHLAQGNDFLCGTIGGMKAPARTPITASATKEALVARLKETFAFCDQALAGLDDSKLAEEVPFFGGGKVTRASAMTITTGDWADHYSQAAIYLRLNGQLPPTAKK